MQRLKLDGNSVIGSNGYIFLRFSIFISSSAPVHSTPAQRGKSPRNDENIPRFHPSTSRTLYLYVLNVIGPYFRKVAKELFFVYDSKQSTYNYSCRADDTIYYLNAICAFIGSVWANSQRQQTSRVSFIGGIKTGLGKYFRHAEPLSRVIDRERERKYLSSTIRMMRNDEMKQMEGFGVGR